MSRFGGEGLPANGGSLGTLELTRQPVMTEESSLQHPGCIVLIHCQHLSLDRWPLMGVAQNPG